MQKNTSKKNKTLSEGTQVFLKTQIIMILSDALLLLIGCAVLYNSQIKQEMYFYFSAVLFCVTAFAGGYYAGYKIRKNGLLTGFLYCLACNIIIVLISLLINKFSFDIRVVMASVFLILCSMFGGVLSVNTRIKAKTKRKGRRQ